MTCQHRLMVEGHCRWQADKDDKKTRCPNHIAECPLHEQAPSAWQANRKLCTRNE